MRTTRTRLPLVACIALCGGVTLGAQTRPVDAAVMLQAAVHQETVNGNLDSAITLYRHVAEDRRADRATVAKALVSLGRAYETLGQGEATRAYQRVVNEFGDQSEQVAMARLRLAAMVRSASRAQGPSPEGITVTQLWNTRASLGIRTVSPDGRRVAFVDWSNVRMEGLRGHADVAVYDLTNRRASLVTDRPPQSLVDTYIEDVIWSPDGQRLAYTLWDTSWTHKDLYVVGANGHRNTLLVNNVQFADLKPMEWSASGVIAALVRGWDDVYRIALVSARDGSTRVVKTLGAHAPHTISVSPDGRYLVYDNYQADSVSDHDLFVLASDGSSETRLAPHPADEPQALFTPDGGRVVFRSRRSGQLGLWAIRVQEGRGIGEPELVRPDIGAAQLLGFTHAGALAYRIPRGESDVFSGTLDLTGNGSLNRVEPITTSYVGRNRRAVWSPDGSRVAFISMRGAGVGEAHLVVRTIDNGEERSHRLPFQVFGRATRPAWTADGSAVLLEGGAIGEPSPSDFRRVTHRIDVATGSVNAQPYIHHASGAAGGIFRYATPRQTQRLAELRLRLFGQSDLQRFRSGDFSLPPGEEPILVRQGVYRGNPGDPKDTRTIVIGHMHSWELSPDGNTLAMALPSDTSKQTSDVLYTMPVAGGPLTEVARVRDQEILVVRWLPDGSGLLYAAARAEYERGVLWHVVLDGTAARRAKLPLDWRQLAELDFDASGGRVAITTATSSSELWLMDGFQWQRRASR